MGCVPAPAPCRPQRARRSPRRPPCPPAHAHNPLPPACEQKGSGKLGYESEAFAIYDTMRYIKPPVATVCVGSAFGEAAMLLAAGEPGRRAALPSASIMIRQPMQRYTQMQVQRVGGCGGVWRGGVGWLRGQLIRRLLRPPTPALARAPSPPPPYQPSTASSHTHSGLRH